MSALPVETTEPDPAASSLSNDETINKGVGDPSAPTDKEAVAAEVKESNGDAAVETAKEELESGETQTDDVEKENGDSAIKGESENEKKSNGSSLSNSKKDPKGMLKTRQKIREGENNSRYDPSVLPETDDPQKIRAQVEFYFGDHNLPSDKFMWELTDGSTNLPVSIEKICTFGRMKRFSPISAVVAALKESKFLDVIGEEGKEQVKRKIAYDPTIPRSRAESRTIYVKGFGDEERSSQFDIEAFFAPYGPTNAVRLRRTDDKLFKGSVFVEFQDEETAQKFLELDPKPKWKGIHELKVMSKKEYTDIKTQEIKDGKIEPRNGSYQNDGRPSYVKRGGNRGGNRGYRNDRDRGSRDNRDRGDRDPDDWKKRREDDRANGFKNDRRRDDHHKRGGRGRGRGGDRGNRNNDRNREREDKRDENKAEAKSESSPVNEKKRSREDSGESELPTQKADTKAEAPKNEKKRSREDNGAEEPPIKKIDSKSEVAIEAS